MKESELCVCGHTAEEHHRSWFPGGYELVEECEAFGTNETGGAEFVAGRWVNHCNQFKLDREANHG